MLHSFVMTMGRVEHKCGLTDTSEIKKIVMVIGQY